MEAGSSQTKKTRKRGLSLSFSLSMNTAVWRLFYWRKDTQTDRQIDRQAARERESDTNNTEKTRKREEAVVWWCRRLCVCVCVVVSS